MEAELTDEKKRVQNVQDDLSRTKQESERRLANEKEEFDAVKYEQF